MADYGMFSVDYMYKSQDVSNRNLVNFKIVKTTAWSLCYIV